MAILEKERNYLDSHKDELLKQYGGKVLIISGEHVAGAFDTMDEALQDVGARYSQNSVLVRRATEAQIEFSAPALTLGILNADSTHPAGSPGKNSGR